MYSLTYLQSGEVPVLTPGCGGVTFLNTLPCTVNIKSEMFTGQVLTHQVDTIL